MKIDDTQVGVGLVEVMVALLLLAVAILGYSALQGQAIKATNESFERSQSIVIMRNIAEKIHANPFAIETYQTNINNVDTVTAPSIQCGLDGAAVTTLCTPVQFAEAESYKIKANLQNYDFQIQMHPCPNTGGNGADVTSNIMFSYCLISAWGNTTATVGSDEDTDCLTATVIDVDDVVEQVGGNYHSKATCMMMEI
ncbi:type IV pilus modification protein PilV [Psychrobacter sp. TAE2020]|uniref:type IV pilus modification protein PilV n=1 Tax=Psychrobacter sp. TAE2020 TaxID=2846762 RepID=UPI001C106150|nr:type IV pilus modification protein PilV [Psychrobacter sp. TAE2020]MBU5616827.1 type IV pilus modification protein PilV [Psychrobacter sp. TAE2020]